MSDAVLYDALPTQIGVPLRRGVPASIAGERDDVQPADVLDADSGAARLWRTFRAVVGGRVAASAGQLQRLQSSNLGRASACVSDDGAVVAATLNWAPEERLRERQEVDERLVRLLWSQGGEARSGLVRLRVVPAGGRLQMAVCGAPALLCTATPAGLLRVHAMREDGSVHLEAEVGAGAGAAARPVCEGGLALRTAGAKAEAVVVRADGRLELHSVGRALEGSKSAARAAADLSLRSQHRHVLCASFVEKRAPERGGLWAERRSLDAHEDRASIVATLGDDRGGLLAIWQLGAALQAPSIVCLHAIDVGLGDPLPLFDGSSNDVCAPPRCVRLSPRLSHAAVVDWRGRLTVLSFDDAMGTFAGEQSPDASAPVLDVCWYADASLLVLFEGGAAVLWRVGGPLVDRLDPPLAARCRAVAAAANYGDCAWVVTEALDVICLHREPPERIVDALLEAQDFDRALAVSRRTGLAADRVLKRRYEAAELKTLDVVEECFCAVDDAAWRFEQLQHSVGATREAMERMIDAAGSFRGTAAFDALRSRFLSYCDIADLEASGYGPTDFKAFLGEGSDLRLASRFARECRFIALRAVLRFTEDADLRRRGFRVLDEVPESVSPTLYRDLLPSLPASEGAAPGGAGAWVTSSGELLAASDAAPEGESAAESVLAWYVARSAAIEERSGRIDLAIELLDACAEALAGSAALERARFPQLRAETAAFAQLLYAGMLDPCFSLAAWRAFGPRERVDALLSGRDASRFDADVNALLDQVAGGAEDGAEDGAEGGAEDGADDGGGRDDSIWWAAIADFLRSGVEGGAEGAMERLRLGAPLLVRQAEVLSSLALDVPYLWAFKGAGRSRAPASPPARRTFRGSSRWAWTRSGRSTTRPSPRAPRSPAALEGIERHLLLCDLAAKYEWLLTPRKVRSLEAASAGADGGAARLKDLLVERIRSGAKTLAQESAAFDWDEVRGDLELVGERLFPGTSAGDDASLHLLMAKLLNGDAAALEAFLVDEGSAVAAAPIVLAALRDLFNAAVTCDADEISMANDILCVWDAKTAVVDFSGADFGADGFSMDGFAVERELQEASTVILELGSDAAPLHLRVAKEKGSRDAILSVVKNVVQTSAEACSADFEPPPEASAYYAAFRAETERRPGEGGILGVGLLYVCCLLGVREEAALRDLHVSILRLAVEHDGASAAVARTLRRLLERGIGAEGAASLLRSVLEFRGDMALADRRDLVDHLLCYAEMAAEEMGRWLAERRDIELAMALGAQPGGAALTAADATERVRAAVGDRGVAALAEDFKAGVFRPPDTELLALGLRLAADADDEELRQEVLRFLSMSSLAAHLVLAAKPGAAGAPASAAQFLSDAVHAMLSCDPSGLTLERFGLEAFTDSLEEAVSSSAATAVTPEPAIVQQVEQMGFSANGARRAAAATKNSCFEDALTYAIAHANDPDFNDPLGVDSAEDEAKREAAALTYGTQTVRAVLAAEVAFQAVAAFAAEHGGSAEAERAAGAFLRDGLTPGRAQRLVECVRSHRESFAAVEPLIARLEALSALQEDGSVLPQLEALIAELCVPDFDASTFLRDHAYRTRMLHALVEASGQRCAHDAQGEAPLARLEQIVAVADAERVGRWELLAGFVGGMLSVATEDAKATDACVGKAVQCRSEALGGTLIAALKADRPRWRDFLASQYGTADGHNLVLLHRILKWSSEVCAPEVKGQVRAAMQALLKLSRSGLAVDFHCLAGNPLEPARDADAALRKEKALAALRTAIGLGGPLDAVKKMLRTQRDGLFGCSPAEIILCALQHETDGPLLREKGLIGPEDAAAAGDQDWIEDLVEALGAQASEIVDLGGAAADGLVDFAIALCTGDCPAAPSGLLAPVAFCEAGGFRSWAPLKLPRYHRSMLFDALPSAVVGDERMGELAELTRASQRFAEFLLFLGEQSFALDVASARIADRVDALFPFSDGAMDFLDALVEDLVHLSAQWTRLLDLDFQNPARSSAESAIFAPVLELLEVLAEAIGEDVIRRLPAACAAVVDRHWGRHVAGGEGAMDAVLGTLSFLLRGKKYAADDVTAERAERALLSASGVLHTALLDAWERGGDGKEVACVLRDFGLRKPFVKSAEDRAAGRIASWTTHHLQKRRHAREAEERASAEEERRLAAEVAAREELERRRLEEEAERQRVAEEEAERQRLAEREAERQRLAAEEAERQRLAQEEAERQRLAAEEAERQRLAQKKSGSGSPGAAAARRRRSGAAAARPRRSGAAAARRRGSRAAAARPRRG